MSETCDNEERGQPKSPTEDEFQLLLLDEIAKKLLLGANAQKVVQMTSDPELVLSMLLMIAQTLLFADSAGGSSHFAGDMFRSVYTEVSATLGVHTSTEEGVALEADCTGEPSSERARCSECYSPEVRELSYTHSCCQREFCVKCACFDLSPSREKCNLCLWGV